MRLIDADALNGVINSLVLQDEKEQEMIQRIIDYAPTANEWIPVSERLPEITNHGERIKQKVLVQTIRGEFFVSYLFREKDGKLFWYKTGEWSWLAGVDKPLAWMPLPPAYQGGDTK